MNLSFLTQATYALLSGCINTPFTGEDIIRTRQLRTRLEAAGFGVYAAMGSYLGSIEPSLFVVFDSRKDTSLQQARILELAAEFNQKQVMFADKGVFTAPYILEARENYSPSNKIVVGAAAMAEEGYTEVVTTEGSVIFSVPDLYDASRPVAARVRIGDSLFAIA